MDLMNRVFKPFLNKFMAVVIDDILVSFKNKDEHSYHLPVVLKTPEEHKMYAKLKKCEFWLKKVHFLGHIMSQEGILVELPKVKAIMSWPRPTNVPKVRSS